MKQEEVSTIYQQVRTKEDENSALQTEMENARQKHEEATRALVAATTTPGHHHVRDLDEEEDDNHLQNGDTSRDLRMDSDEIVDPVTERQSMAEKSVKYLDKLKAMKKTLSVTWDPAQETTMDRIHNRNTDQGNDKYRTLREVRRGNTKRRVDQFENM